MKRLFLGLCFLLSVIVLSGCFNIDTVKADFEMAGYVYSEDPSGLIDDVIDGLTSDEITYSTIVYTIGTSYAVIINFASIEDLNNEYDNNTALISLLDGFSKADLTKNTYLLIPVSSYDSVKQQMIDLFNGDFSFKRVTEK